jgi:hypothetical protein
MRFLIILLLIFSTSYFAVAQKFDVDTIQMNGSTDKFINIVILGDGYTQSQLNDFINDAKNTINGF